MNLSDFVIESNRIEGITRDGEDLQRDIEAHEYLLNQDELTVQNISDFVYAVSGAKLRNKSGMNVFIGDHKPIDGSEEVERQLFFLLVDICANALTPYEAHCRYETLHPFMDGNGRSGRVIWLWHAGQNSIGDWEDVIFRRGFLHNWYYQSLDNSRKG